MLQVINANPPTRRVHTRIVSFFALPMFSLLAPSLILPLIARVASTSEWAAVALGQSVGAVAAVFINYGWSLTGPATLARAPRGSSVKILADCLCVRGSIFIALTPIASMCAWALAPGDTSTTALLMCAAACTGGLSITWYASGRGAASLVAKYELAPRLIATFLAAPVVAATREVVLYPTFLLVGSSFGLFFFARRTLREYSLTLHLRDFRLFNALRCGWVAAATEAAAGVYSSGTVALVGIAATTSGVALYSAGDRLYRMALVGVIALSNAIQGWVAEPDSNPGRHRTALALHSMLGVFGGAAIALLGPSASALMFGHRLAVDSPTAMGFGVAFLCVSVNTSLGRQILIPENRADLVLTSTAGGAIVGVPLILTMTAHWASRGAASALAISELVVVVVMTVPVIRSRANLVRWLTRRGKRARIEDE